MNVRPLPPAGAAFVRAILAAAEVQDRLRAAERAKFKKERASWKT